jgi:predicted nucleotidyltransferase
MEEALASVLSLFSADPRILAGYLFGSRAAGASSPYSDIDIAFHASNDFAWNNYYMLWRDISKAFRSDRFDLLWLDRAAPDITFDVIKFGRMIFHRDDELLNDFELYAKKRFWDYKIYLRERLLAREADRA